MGKLLVLAVFGILTALVVERIVRLRQAFNISREYEELEPPNCRFIEGIETGAEDIDILPNGLAFLSAGLKYPGVHSFAPDEHGSMLLLDLNEEEPKLVILKISSGFDIDSFNPHGISLYVNDKDDSVYIFVVNHPKISTTVELFRFQEEEKSLLHLQTIEHELLQSVNDIAAVGPESFYATNDHYFLNPHGRLAEDYLTIPLENIVYYSPNEVKEVASGFNFANGITMSHDKKYVYACSMFDNSISVFEKHTNWSLSPVKELQIDKVVDNLCLDPTTGDVWIGCHIDAWNIFNYDPKSLPGSEHWATKMSLNLKKQYHIILGLKCINWVPVEAMAHLELLKLFTSPTEIEDWVASKNSAPLPTYQQTFLNHLSSDPAI